MVTYEKKFDQQVRFDARIEVYGETSACCGYSPTLPTSPPADDLGHRGARGDAFLSPLTDNS